MMLLLTLYRSGIGVVVVATAGDGETTGVPC